MPSTQAPSTCPLVEFYDPKTKGKDFKNRTLLQILGWGDDKLEYYHDYIQVLFPLPEGSPFNPSAPIIDQTTFSAFRSQPELQANLRMALVRMLRFYGFEMRTGGTIAPGANFHVASRNWVKRFNHNHLRITRIIRSLRVLGLENAADEFFKALEDVYGRSEKISEKSMMFWNRAAKRPLFIAPEDDEDGGIGAGFLYEFEKKRMGGEVDGQ